ncbi:hypothetical protein AB0907_10925 [Streptomyces sp. NPDC006975]|uniref:hypothetical protein n=1 Tax=Streptomyces sp. NPDC006975 TaxID=3154310 RepID=UPI003454519E
MSSAHQEGVAYQRAADYVAASVIFLRGNVLLREPRQLGHWGSIDWLPAARDGNSLYSAVIDATDASIRDVITTQEQDNTHPRSRCCAHALQVAEGPVTVGETPGCTDQPGLLTARI